MLLWVVSAPSSVEIFNFLTVRVKRLKFWQNDVLMSTSFCQNFSLLTFMVKKLKISTLDGAETNSKTHTTLLIPDNQSIGCINFNSINYRNLTRARMKTTVLLIKMKKNWKGLIFLEGPKSHLGSILSCFKPIFFGKI